MGFGVFLVRHAGCWIGIVPGLILVEVGAW